MERLIGMILRRFMGQIINRGINAGINRASRGRAPEGEQARNPADNTQETQQRMRQLGRVTRRLTRF